MLIINILITICFILKQNHQKIKMDEYDGFIKIKIDDFNKLPVLKIILRWSHVISKFFMFIVIYLKSKTKKLKKMRKYLYQILMKTTLQQSAMLQW